MSDEIQRFREENTALQLQIKKLNRQIATQKNVLLHFEKISANRDRVASVLRVEQSKQEKYMNMMLQNSSHIIILLDGEGYVAYCTNTFLKKVGVEDFSLIDGRHYSEVFSRLNNKDFLEHITDCINRAKNEFAVIQGQEALAAAGTGEVRLYFTNTIAMRDPEGVVEGLMLLFHDVTETIQAKDAAEAASKAKSVFLATMSHEIRTPLNAIIGLSEIQLQKKLPEETREDLEKIFNSGSALLGIINDILDISKIETGNFELVPVEYDTPSLINDTVQLNIVRIGSKSIIFKLNIDDTIPRRLFGDELRIKQILNNLLSNAFKYTREGAVTLWVHWEHQLENALMIFTITDTGQGIRKEDLGKLFSEYTQLDTRMNRKIEGTGLGLSITKKLAEMMDGTITVESEYGKGSSFTVRLPQRIMDRQSIGLEVVENLQSFRFIETRRFRSKNLVRTYMPYGRVLVVDDVSTNLDVARGLMLPYGLTIDCVQSGQEAIDRIRKKAVVYDVIFMDHMMPGMDGIEATRIIRNEINTEYAKTVPIIALTANALAGNEEIFLSAGFNAFVAKPIDIMRLDVILNQWIRDKQGKETLWKTKPAEDAGEAQVQPAALLNETAIKDIDLAGGIRRYRDDAIYLSILRSYTVHTPELLEKLRSFSRETLGDYAITVHGLKGASYGICAEGIGKDAEELEQAAKAGDYETVRDKNLALIGRVETLLADIRQMLENTPEKGPARKKAAVPDRVLLEKLLDASKRFKSTVMEEVLEELEGYEYESGGDLVEWLREQIDNLEYDAIRERLEVQV